MIKFDGLVVIWVVGFGFGCALICLVYMVGGLCICRCLDLISLLAYLIWVWGLFDGGVCALRVGLFVSCFVLMLWLILVFCVVYCSS